VERVELKTIGELVDELTIVNLKIWHEVDKGYAGDGEAAVQAQHLNARRNALMRAITGRLEPDMPVMPKKSFE